MADRFDFRRLRRVAGLAVILVAWVGGVQAQGNAGNGEAGPYAPDTRLFYGIYRVEAPAFRGVMRGVDATAWPAFYGSAAAAWLGVWIARDGEDWSDAYRLTVSELGTLGATVGLKYLVRRTRPYLRLPDVESRAGDIARWDPYSFPSGHAAISFALVTSWTLSHPRWYVAVPGYLWATSIAVSRVWLGVHYPGDVLAGALLGAATAWGIHALGSTVTPAFLRDDGDRPALPVIHLRLALP